MRPNGVLVRYVKARNIAVAGFWVGTMSHRVLVALLVEEPNGSAGKYDTDHFVGGYIFTIKDP